MNSDSASTKVIAEIGINHRGQRDVAQQLVDIAIEAGAWGVKFQYRSKDDFYKSISEIGDEIISDELARSYLPPATILELCERARAHGVAAGVSFFRFSDAADFSSQIDEFDFFKAPSAELMNFELIESLAKLGKLVFISTGGHDEKDIETAIEATRKHSNLLFMHCISNYPVLLGNQQMQFIKRLKTLTRNEVGYSSHDQDWEACLLAAANGATYFERHLTLDKNGPGLDDSSSSDPPEFHRLCRLLRNVPLIQGDGRRRVNQGEMINMQNLGSSLYATVDIDAGDEISAANTELRTPRKGLTRIQLERLADRRVKRRIAQNEPITKLHFQPPAGLLDPILIEFCNDRLLSIPIRLHDVAVLQKRFPIQHFELHLSYGEVRLFAESPEAFLAKIDLDRTYSIHLPDYLPGNRLIDPLSKNESTQRDSREMIDVCVRLATHLRGTTGIDVPVVGSFSRLQPDGKQATMERLSAYLSAIKAKDDVVIMPQWLPRIAWYFGGAEELDMFCGRDDIDLVLETGMTVCLDLSHLILSANRDNAAWRDWYDLLIPAAGHIHIADATGIDGEGVGFGEGDLGDVTRFLALPQRKVMEVWQGHLEDGEGFDRAIRYLHQCWRQS